MRGLDCSSTEVVRPARRAAPFATLTVQAPARLPVLLLLPWPAGMPWPAAATSPCRCGGIELLLLPLNKLLRTMLCMHAGVLSTGHCHPKVVEAIQRQARDAARLLHAGGASVLRVGASSSYHRQFMTGLISAWIACMHERHCALPCPATLLPAGRLMATSYRRRRPTRGGLPAVWKSAAAQTCLCLSPAPAGRPDHHGTTEPAARQQAHGVFCGQPIVRLAAIALQLFVRRVGWH